MSKVAYIIFGSIAFVIIVFGIALFIMYRTDKRDKRIYEPRDIDEYDPKEDFI